MERSTFWVSTALATDFAFALPFVAETTHADFVGVPQIRSFKVSGIIFAQDASEKTGNDVLGKNKFNEKLLGANCVDQEKLAKGQIPVIILFDPCSGDLDENQIAIFTREPLTSMTIGKIDFDVASQIANQKKGVDRTLTMPATVQLICLGAVSVDVEASAIATVKLDSEGVCVESVRLKNGSGTGIIDGINVILDGFKMDVK